MVRFRNNKSVSTNYFFEVIFMAFVSEKELKKLKQKEKWFKIGFVFIFALFLFVANQDMGVYVLGITTNTGSMKPYIYWRFLCSD